MDIHRTMIVPAALAPIARALAAGLSPGGVGMFQAGLVIIDRALTAGETAALTAYLNAKAGV